MSSERSRRSTASNVSRFRDSVGDNSGGRRGSRGPDGAFGWRMPSTTDIVSVAVGAGNLVQGAGWADALAANASMSRNIRPLTPQWSAGSRMARA
ncbi:MAG: hypothetical protein H0W30_10615 [Gemmatimonadaceae bacterium]|nr:hypothetical protein [Gemmatimonadaceae bacterium]MDQ3516351.1 hypothetical protein [Gemmatimonadota bacterium]